MTLQPNRDSICDDIMHHMWDDSEEECSAALDEIDVEVLPKWIVICYLTATLMRFENLPARVSLFFRAKESWIKEGHGPDKMKAMLGGLEPGRK